MFNVGDEVEIISVKDIDQPELEDYPHYYLNGIGIIEKVFEWDYPYLIKFHNKPQTDLTWHKDNLNLIKSNELSKFTIEQLTEEINRRNKE